jgi:hypothetical protein
MTSLDRVMPAFHHRERHSRWIDASPQAVWDALHRVSFRDLLITRLALTLRTLPARLAGRPGSAPAGSFLADFQARGFIILAEQPGRELVVGAIGRFWRPAGAGLAPIRSPAEFVAFARPGWAKAATDFRIEPTRGGSRLSTETRILATDRSARRAFTAYWIVIRLGSGLIRRDILRAIARRAERERFVEPVDQLQIR